MQAIGKDSMHELGKGCGGFVSPALLCSTGGLWHTGSIRFSVQGSKKRNLWRRVSVENLPRGSRFLILKAQYLGSQTESRGCGTWVRRPIRISLVSQDKLHLYINDLLLAWINRLTYNFKRFQMVWSLGNWRFSHKGCRRRALEGVGDGRGVEKSNMSMS